MTDTREAFEEIVVGIDIEQCENDIGWWDTTKGAKFGAKVKGELWGLLQSKQAEIDALEKDSSAATEMFIKYESALDELTKENEALKGAVSSMCEVSEEFVNICEKYSIDLDVPSTAKSHFELLERTIKASKGDKQ